MDRRTFLCGLTLGTLSAPLAAEVQQQGKVPRIGVLAEAPFAREAFRQGLREFGYVDGQNMRAGRVARIGGGNVLRLGKNPATQLLYRRIDHAPAP